MSTTSFLDQFDATRYPTVVADDSLCRLRTYPIGEELSLLSLIVKVCLPVLVMHPKYQMPTTICGTLGSLFVSLDSCYNYSRLSTKEIALNSLMIAEGIAGLFSKEASNVLTLALKSIDCHTSYKSRGPNNIYFVLESIDLVVFAILSFSKHNQLVRCALIVRSAVNARYIYNNRPEKLSVSNLVSASVMVICLRQAYLMGSA